MVNFWCLPVLGYRNSVQQRQKSVLPVLVPHGQAIEQLPVLLPLWHVAIHQSDEASIVRRLKQMHHLVDDDVLKALRWFFGQVRIQSNTGRCRVAAPPTRFHPLNEKSLDRNPQMRLPSRNQVWNLKPQLLSVPSLQNLLSLATIRSRSNDQCHFVDPYGNRWRLVFFNHSQQHPLPPYIVALAIDVVPRRLALLGHKLPLLLLDPS